MSTDMGDQIEDYTSSSLDFEHEEKEDITRLLSSEIEATVLPDPHIFNSDYHSVYIRYGIPIFIVATFSLLMASDIGVGASAHVEMSINGKVTSSQTNLEISVFSSIKKLWENDAVSYTQTACSSFTSSCLINRSIS